MSLMDTVKRAMNGRSGSVEKAVDGAVKGFGRIGDALSKQGERLKTRARDLDGDHAGGTEVVDLTTPPAPPPTKAPEIADDQGGAPAKLRGDLAP